MAGVVEVVLVVEVGGIVINDVKGIMDLKILEQVKQNLRCDMEEVMEARPTGVHMLFQNRDRDNCGLL